MDDCWTNRQTTAMMKVMLDTHVSLVPSCMGMMLSEYELHHNNGAERPSCLLSRCEYFKGAADIKTANVSDLINGDILTQEAVFSPPACTLIVIHLSHRCYARHISKRKHINPEIVIQKSSSYPRHTTGDSVKAFRTPGWKYAKHTVSSPHFLWLLLACWHCHMGGVSQGG